jgi:AcrR family transcriptional regulator
VTHGVAPTDGTGRRSHAERTGKTVELIIDATIDAIAEIGLRNATTGEISRRAGVSIGALFHHFGTRLDLIVAAVEHHLELRFTRFSEVADALLHDATRAEPRALIGAFRSITREPRSMVWLEVLMAARTDPELRARVAPILEAQRDRFRASADAKPGLRTLPVLERHTWVELLRTMVIGESIWEPVLSHHELDEPKLDALLALAGHFAERNSAY